MDRVLEMRKSLVAQSRCSINMLKIVYTKWNILRVNSNRQQCRKDRMDKVLEIRKYIAAQPRC